MADDDDDKTDEPELFTHSSVFHVVKLTAQRLEDLIPMNLSDEKLRKKRHEIIVYLLVGLGDHDPAIVELIKSTWLNAQRPPDDDSPNVG